MLIILRALSTRGVSSLCTCQHSDYSAYQVSMTQYRQSHSSFSDALAVAVLRSISVQMLWPLCFCTQLVCRCFDRCGAALIQVCRNLALRCKARQRLAQHANSLSAYCPTYGTPTPHMDASTLYLQRIPPAYISTPRTVHPLHTNASL